MKIPALSAAIVASLLGLAAASAPQPIQAAEPSNTAGDGKAAGTGFHFKAVNDKSLGLWEDYKPVLVYNHGDIARADLPDVAAHTSYIHPLYGLDGGVLTDDFPKDHRAHRGLYWAWPSVKSGDDEFDLWGLRGIRIEFQRWLARDTSDTEAMFAVENAWVAGGRKIVQERATVHIFPATEQGRAIDVELVWTPLDKPLSLKGAKDKSYGGLTLRMAPRTDEVITVHDKRTTEDLVVTRLQWADYSGKFEGSSAISGAAIFVHPENQDYPPTWMTRHYGVLAVGWPGVDGKTFAAGEPITCRYRVWIHRGLPEPATLQKINDIYRALNKVLPQSMSTTKRE